MIKFLAERIYNRFDCFVFLLAGHQIALHEWLAVGFILVVGIVVRVAIEWLADVI